MKQYIAMAFLMLCGVSQIQAFSVQPFEVVRHNPLCAKDIVVGFISNEQGIERFAVFSLSNNEPVKNIEITVGPEGIEGDLIESIVPYLAAYYGITFSGQESELAELIQDEGYAVVEQSGITLLDEQWGYADEEFIAQHPGLELVLNAMGNAGFSGLYALIDGRIISLVYS